MKIALAQINYTVGDICGNSTKIIAAIERGKAEGADVVIFAEQALCGTPAFDLLRKTTFLELCDEELSKIALHCQGIAAVVGTPMLSESGTHSAAAILEHGKVRRYVTKSKITARREMGFLSNGKGIETVKIAGEKVAIVVGDDFSSLKRIDRDVQILISINARRYGKGMMSYRYQKMHNTAFVNSKDIVLINQVGGSGEIVYDGTSGVFNSRGELTLMMKSFEEDFTIYDTKADNAPCQLPEELYSHERTALNFKAAVLGLRDYFHKSGYTKACVGLSGGIDSSIVACIAAEALGKENVLGLLMPSQFSSDHSVTDATLLAESLGIEYSVLPISEAYTSIVNTLKPVIGGREFDSTEENIQARLRTIMLMAVQNKKGYVLLNSSNKSENALGFCTLYGDTAGAFSVTGDLYKTEMYDLARYINKTFDNVIPQNIIEKEPSSELHPGQKDSDILPPYDVVDAILLRMVEQEQHREEIINAGFDSDVVEKIHSLVMQNEKKRYQFPPVLRLSAYAFGHERLMPLINKYGD
ncbi:MAG: NAD+ synthase [Rikenellaceae bacterium]|nr:NAD+ synthase [Rikenellaceae bacterium]